MKRPARPPRRPNFKPAWTREEGVEAVRRRTAPDAVENVAVRVAALALSMTAEQLAGNAATAGSQWLETAIAVFDEAEKHLVTRLELQRAARARLCWAAHVALRSDP